MASESKSTIEKLNGTNYASWSYQMKMTLMEADLWSVIEPGEEEPAENPTEIQKKQYITRQGRAHAKIALAICDEQQMHIRNKASAKEVWDELQKLYAPRDSKFRTVQLRRQLYSHKMSDSGSMENYLGQINRTVGDLSSVGDVIDDSDIAMVILCGLSSDYDNVASNLCSLPADEFKSATVKMRLLAEDARRRDSSESKEAALMAFNKRKPWKNKPTQGSKQETSKGKQSGDSVEKRQKQRKFVCYHCQQSGHIAKFCPEREKKKGNNANANVVALSVSCGSAKVNSDCWIIDSGATHHMTPNEGYFSKLDRNVKEEIILADGSTTPALGRGTVNVKIRNGLSRIEKFRAENTLLAPGLDHGILSVRTLIENEKKIIFDEEGCSICDKNGELLIKAQQQGRLYVVGAEPCSRDVMLNNVSSKVNGRLLPLDMWHKRMMHVSKLKILEMSKANSVVGMNVATDLPTKCDDCLAGKSTRQPFPKDNISPKNNTRKTSVLELVHSDLMGPIDVESWGKNRYLLSFVDDASRYVHARFLRYKNQAFEEFKKWKVEVEKQTGRKLKRLRTDNGLEFCSKQWTEFCEAEGICHETTMVYTPQQNGIAERFNRTLMDLLRATLHETSLPKGAWAELLDTAVHVRNRVTNSHDSKETPYEIWTGKKPNVSYFREIGCEVFVHIPKPRRHSKLTPRAERGTLIGYAKRGRGYRVWMQESGKIEESRDCVFKEKSYDVSINPGKTLKQVVEFNSENSPCEPVPEGDNEDDYEEDGTNINSEDKRLLSEEEDFEDARDKTLPDGEELEDVMDQPLRVLPNPVEESEQETPKKKRGRPKREEQKKKEVIPLEMTLRSRRKESDNPQTNLATGIKDDVPTSYRQAIESEESLQWLEAMNEEYNSLMAHDSWDLVELPPGVKPVKCRWVYARKVTGDTQRLKARLVAKGCTQKKGVDYEEVYAPVSNFETVRLLVAAGVEKGWKMDQYDVKSAYLHSRLEQVVYMDQPEGFVRKGEEKLVCRLAKSIYGLKQSGRCWNEHMNESLTARGFVRNKVDTCVYELDAKEGRAILTVYVDDMVSIAENEATRKLVKKLLDQCFDVKHLGGLTSLLGVKFCAEKDGSMSLSQEAYIEKLVHRFGLQDAKGIATPMEVRPTFLDEKSDEGSSDRPYRELIGGLLYLSQRTRPDIAFSVAKLAQFCTCNNEDHWNAARRVLRYLKETKHLKLVYRPTGENLTAYSDADWATSTLDRKSISGYVVLLAGAPVFWRSVKQTSVALSTMEAEYISLAECTREVVWMKNLLESIGLNNLVGGSTSIWCDSQAAIAHAESYVSKSRTKHIAIRHHYIREKTTEKSVRLKYVSTHKNLADLLTKSLGRNQLEVHRSRMLQELP